MKRLQWTAHFCEAAPNGKKSRADVVLMTPGPSTASTMFYPEDTVSAAAAVFAGAVCHIDHDTDSQERERPERSLATRCGYFSGVRYERGELRAVLNLGGPAEDLARAAIETAVKYQREYGDGNGRQFCGLSIAADGESHSESSDVLAQRYPQYREQLARLPAWDVVTRIDRGGADLVTRAARGGKVLSLRESMKYGHESEGLMDNQEMLQDLRDKVLAVEDTQSPEAIAALIAAVKILIEQGLYSDDEGADSREAVPAVAAFREAYEPRWYYGAREAGNAAAAVEAFGEQWDERLWH